MPSQTITRQSPLTEELTTETVDATPDRRDVPGHREPSRSPSTSVPRPSSSPTTPAPSFAQRRRLTTTYLHGDFASGQRTLPVPVALVGTFASR